MKVREAIEGIRKYGGGIDEYQTVSVPAYMYDDMMWAFCDKYGVE